MTQAPRLIEVRVPRDVAACVLVLHGGGGRGGHAMVSPAQLSVLRMIPIARRLAAAGRGRVAVSRLLNTVRGWDAEHTPVSDARWALDRIAERLQRPCPTCLVGHSLGGRAALLTAGHPAVVSVAALAPWVYPDDVTDGLAGKPILIVHGSSDRVADPARSAALARRLRVHTEVRYVTVGGGGHAMLRHRRAFESEATEFALRTLAV